MSSVPDWRCFFDPDSVAIIGATNQPGFGFGIPRFLQKQGHGHKLRLVNPKGGTMHGLPVYKSVLDIEDEVDLAVIIVPAGKLPEVMQQVGQKGIRHAIIESAGFGETGSAGRELHERTLAIARGHRVRIIGPNCVGIVNTINRFATVEVVEESLIPGPVSIIAQSGVFGNILLDGLFEKGIYLSKAITRGNRMDLNECDLLLYLKDDPDTKVIIMYLEGAAQGPRLRQVLQEVTQKKPVIILKSGRTGPGKAATASHTGSLSGQDELYEGMFSQAGAIRARSLEELVDLALVFSCAPLPQGDRVGIVTSSGSLAALAVDTLVDLGLKTPELSDSVKQAMLKNAPRWMNVRNPLDVGPSGLFRTALEALLPDQAVDMLIAITVIPYAVLREFENMGLKPEFIMGNIENIRTQSPQKPLIVVAVGNSNWIKLTREVCGKHVPVLTSPEAAAHAAWALVKYSKARKYFRQEAGDRRQEVFSTRPQRGNVH